MSNPTDPFRRNREFLNRLMAFSDASDTARRMDNHKLAIKIQTVAAQLPDDTAPFLLEAAERLYPIELTNNELGKN